ncbi:hypothetical protein N9V52_06060, partial [Flavobacteriaceae bacterium]|nr:hypothetical protein [Flavobacteriaceae bacterium]
MKKGLLSLLAVALTIVSCQDYDDQFAELTGLVNDLSTEVEGLTQVQTQLSSLSTTVSGLSSAIAAIPTTDSTADLTGLTTDLAAAQTAIDAITAALADVADAADLAAVDAAIVALQEDVNTLLEADAVINQNVTINNSATLEYVSTLIAHGEDDPNVIVNGSVTINTTTFTPAITEAQLAEVNAIAAKLATVLGSGSTDEGVTVTSATPITFTNLSFIDDDYVVSGADMDDAALRTVSGDVTASHGGAPVAFDYSQLASIGGDLVIAAADAATATSINLSGVAITGTFGEAGQSPGNLTFEGATTVDLGTAGFHKLTAAKATSIVSGMTTTGSLTINATNGGTIDINSLEEVTGTGVVALTGATTSVFHLDALTDADGTITSTVAGEVHLPALTAHGAIDISATDAVALTSLVTSTATIDLDTTPAAILTNFAEAAHTFTWNIGVINLPNVNLEVPMSTTATDVTIKSFDAIGDVGSTVTKLVLTAQDADVAGTDAVTDLSITAAAGADVDYASAGNNLVTVSVDGTTLNTFGTQTALKSIALANTSTNTIAADTAVSTVTLSGTLVSFTSDSTTLAEFNNTATFLDKPGNTDTPIKIHIHDALLTSIDLSSMEKVAIVDIQDNTNLTTVIAPTGATNLLTANAGASFTVKGNSLTATYTNSTAAFAGDGINPATPYAEACIYSPSLASWLAYATAVLTTNATVTLDLDYSNPQSFDDDCTDDT